MRSLLLLQLLLPFSGVQGAAQYPRSKGAATKKQVARGIGWMSEMSLPVPNGAYESKQAIIDGDEHRALGVLLYDIDYWRDDLPNYDNLTEADIQDPTNTFCDAEDDGVNATFSCKGPGVPVPEYIAWDLNAYASDSDAFGPNNATYSNWGDYFLEQANKSHAENKSQGVLSELDKQYNVIYNETQISYYRLIADYMGAGWDTECRAYVARAISTKDAYDQAGWQAATVLMALIPALLTIGNLFVPRSSEVFGTSFIVGFMSSVFSLGLPVTSISGVRSKQHFSLSLFGYKSQRQISRLGKQDNPETTEARQKCDIGKLQQFSANVPDDDMEDFDEDHELTSCAFWSIKHRCLKWRRRAHAWQIPALLIALVQFAVFICLICPLFLGLGTPLFLLDCENKWTSLWLIICAAISAIFRFTMWELGSHERVKMYALSDTAQREFRSFAERTELYKDGRKINHTETELPPLYIPILIKPALWIERAKARVHGIFRRRASRKGQQRPTLLPRHSQSDSQGQTQPSSIPAPPTTWDRYKSFPQSLWQVARAEGRRPKGLLQLGFKSHQPSYAAMRYRPLYILMHLSTAGRSPLMTLFTGFVEGAILISLTFFFGAQWGGNLVVMIYTLALLLVAITFGRGLGLAYVCHSAKVWGLHVIETDTAREVLGCLRILCSTTEVLVNVNGAWYFEGNRLDVRKDWAKVKLRYDKGDFDGPLPTTAPAVNTVNAAQIAPAPTHQSQMTNVTSATATATPSRRGSQTGSQRSSTSQAP